MMNAVIIEHVPVTDLPTAWQEKLPTLHAARVTVRIEEEINLDTSNLPDNPLFGLWRDREDIKDVAAYVEDLRRPRNFADDAKSPS
jgi:uncharacterized protein YhdP